MDTKSYYIKQAILCVAEVAEKSGLNPFICSIMCAKTLLGYSIPSASGYVKDLLKNWTLIEMQLLEYVQGSGAIFLHTPDRSIMITDYFLSQCAPEWKATLEESIKKIKPGDK